MLEHLKIGEIDQVVAGGGGSPLNHTAKKPNPHQIFRIFTMPGCIYLTKPRYAISTIRSGSLPVYTKRLRPLLTICLVAVEGFFMNTTNDFSTLGTANAVHCWSS